MATVKSPPLDLHWRARLAEVQDLLLVAHEVDDVVRALLAMTNLLSDEWTQRDDPVRQLLREAFELLANPDTRLDLRDWLKAAEPFVRR
jgi:hypothetical protein